MYRDKAVTLLELIVVVIIISILATVTGLNYQRTIEQARDKEALACLRLIRTGERIYRSEHEPPQFFPWDTVAEQSQTNASNQINPGLRLSLTTQNWHYFVTELNQSDNFRARAVRQNAPANFSREWIITNADCNPTFGAYCNPLNPGACPSQSNNSLSCP